MHAFHPLIVDWFQGRFGAATPAQREAWPRIAAGDDVLVSAPTGSGKTLAAFLICLDRLVAAGLAGQLRDQVDVIYVSPLKALSNDVGRNLDTPLAELEAMAAERGLPVPGIRTAVRTGDTPASERARMLRRPPHILVTTPESPVAMPADSRAKSGARPKRVRPTRTAPVAVFLREDADWLLTCAGRVEADRYLHLSRCRIGPGRCSPR
jgi:ATP-dependent Lhr-like helicase